jgi:hypothetical protein
MFVFISLIMKFFFLFFQTTSDVGTLYTTFVVLDEI